MSNYFNESEKNFSNTTNEGDSVFNKAKIYYQQISDKMLYYKKERWTLAAVVFFMYFLRIILVGGYYALTYCIGIHLLNSFLGFISPLEDPEDNEEGESYLPQRDTEEFRPFERKVKEFSLWQTVFWSFFIGFFLTFNRGIDLPVFWPMLLIYFIIIFYLTMRKQINHMIKYNYLPWTTGKARY